MNVKRLLLRYAFAIALREWMRGGRIRPQTRIAITALAGALIAPFVVFVGPIARLYWLISGKQLPRPLGFVTPQPYAFVSRFPVHHPPEIRELLALPEYNWEPGPGDIPRWHDIWARVGQVLYWQSPIGLGSHARKDPHHASRQNAGSGH